MLSAMDTKRRWLCCLMTALGVVSMAVAAEPLPLDGEGARVAVVADRPGEEVVFCGGVLQECVGMDIPLQVVFLEDEPEASVLAMDAAEVLDLPVDVQDFLSEPAELAGVLDAFQPTLLLATPGAAEAVAGVAGEAKVLVAEKGAKKADYELELMDVQLEAKAEALGVYGRKAKGDKEYFRDPKAASVAGKTAVAAPVAEAPAAPVRRRLVPMVPAGKAKPAPLAPKTHLPPPPSPWDEPVVW